MSEPLLLEALGNLKIEGLIDVARRRLPVAVATSAWDRIALSRRVVAELVGKNVKIYGVTTGFASMREKVLAPGDFPKLSLAILRSHAVGAGAPFAEDVVRAAMLLRLRSFAHGCSGVHPDLVRLLIATLNSGIYPYVPQQGSLGASGDLAPLSHLFLAVIGDPAGRVHKACLADPAADSPSARRSIYETHSDRARTEEGYFAEPRADDFVALVGNSRKQWAARVLKHLPTAEESAVHFKFDLPVKAGELDPYPKSLDVLLKDAEESAPDKHSDASDPVYMPRPKEGLAANNGATFSAALLALTVVDAQSLLRTSELTCALSFEALQAVPDCLDDGLVELRDHAGHRAMVDSLRNALTGSELVPLDRTRGVNSARLNRAIMELGALAKKRVEESDESSSSDESVVRKQRERLVKLVAADIWSTLDDAYRERMVNSLATPDRAVTEYSRAIEVEVGRKHFKTAIDSMRNCVSGVDSTAVLSEKAWSAVAKVFHEHVSKIVQESGNPEVQDNYCFRAAATVLGIAHEAIGGVLGVIATEINAVTDNPILLLESIMKDMSDNKAEAPWNDEKLDSWFNARWPVAANAVKSGANFHGEPIGAAAERLSVAIAELASISERRVACLTDKNHSKGLPSYVGWSPGLNSAFMMPQYTAASLVSDNKGLAWPQTVDSLTSGENTEDHVSMSMIATRRCAQILANAEHVVAIELMTAYQGVQFRKPAKLANQTGFVESRIAVELLPVFKELYGNDYDQRAWLPKVHLASVAAAAVRPCVLDDVPLYRVIDAVAWLVRRGEVVKAVDRRPA